MKAKTTWYIVEDREGENVAAYRLKRDATLSSKRHGGRVFRVKASVSELSEDYGIGRRR